GLCEMRPRRAGQLIERVRLRGAERDVVGMNHFPLVALLGLISISATSTPADGANPTAWTRCSNAAGAAAARDAGLPSALDADPVLRRVFAPTKPTATYKRPTTSLCGDFDGDGQTDRAVLYQCCTVSSPAPWAVLRRRGG